MFLLVFAVYANAVANVVIRLTIQVLFLTRERGVTTVTGYWHGTWTFRIPIVWFGLVAWIGYLFFSCALVPADNTTNDLNTHKPTVMKTITNYS